MERVKKVRILRTIFFSGILMLAVPFFGKAQTAPKFDTVFFTRSICENEPSIDISAYLNAHDIDPGQIVTITNSIPAVLGVVNIPTGNESAPSGGAVTFSGITYVPNADTSGNDHIQFTIDDDHGDGNGSIVDIYIVINGKPKPHFASTALAVCTGATSAFLGFTDTVDHTGPITTVFPSRGVSATFIVPNGVTSLKFDISGSVGGNDNVSGNPKPGKGGQVTGILSVHPAQALFINVGLRGVASDPSFPDPSRGFGGGGGAFLSAAGSGGSGGGGTDIRLDSNVLLARAVVAGGGGGAGASIGLAPMAGGDGGNPAGGNSAVNGDGSAATGGDQNINGFGATYATYSSGSNGALIGEQAGDGSHSGVSGGGGGGFYGGGGGVWTGGGGGSSWASGIHTSSVVFTNGAQAGDGLATLIYELPGTYKIDFDGAAKSENFVDVPVTFPIPPTGISITVPADAHAGIYHATITFSNSVCESAALPFTIEVKQTPEVNVVPNQVVCNDLNSTINFTPLIGTTPTYEWNNDNPLVGAPPSGTGNVNFTAVNTGTVPLVATFTVTPKEFGCTGTPVSFTITTNPLPGLTLGALPMEVCSGTTTTSLSFSDLVNIGSFTNTYNYLSGNTMPQIFTVPSGVTTVNFEVVGAIGGSDDLSPSPNPGKGARVQGVLNVAAPGPLNIYVGSRGFNGSPYGAAGGYNGGADAFYYSTMGSGGAGGGASDIRFGGTALTNRIIVAGGGGGSGYDNPLGYAGGDGGGLTGGNSTMNVNGSYAGGGTQASGGAGATFLSFVPGGNGSLGMGGAGSLEGISGGGGGGYYGGGGGVWTGGGGGSSYTDPVSTTLVTHTPGFNIGDGYVILNYVTIGTYAITWGTSATATGFQNVDPTDLPIDGKFPITVPSGATAGTYTGTLIIDNGLCGHNYPISIIVHPAPDVTVTPPAQPAVCVGDTATTIILTGTLPSTKFYLTNDNPSIGLPAFDSADIYPAFVTTNATTVTQVASVTITPVSLLGCVGTTASFTVTVNPAPKLSSPLTDTVCSYVISSYVANSATPGTTYSWERLAVADISTPPNTGTTAAIGEPLTNTSFVPVPAYYTYSLTANGCTAAQTVTVTVNPLPVLSNFPLKDTVCSMQDKHLVPASFVNGTNFTWAINFTAGSTIPDSTSGADSVTLVFGNTSNAGSIDVKVDFQLTANGCVNNQSFHRVIKPVAELTSDHSRSVCSGAHFIYSPELSITDPSIATSYMWNRISVADVTTSDVNLGNVDIDHTLTNTTALPIVVPYEFQLSTDGCNSPFDTVFVTLEPLPHLKSTKDTAVCSGSPFTYTPASATSAASGTLTYDWIRLMPTGISATGAPFGTGNASDLYTNPGTTPLQLRLIYSLQYNGCSDENSDTVLVAVNPTPKFDSLFDPIKVCDSSRLIISETSRTPGTTFAWSRPGPSVVPGIVNTAATGTGNVLEYLYNTTNTPVTTYYTYSISANGCPGESKTQYVTVQPDPTLASTLTPHYVCTNAPFHYEAQSYVAGASFDWTRASVYGIYSNGGIATGFGKGNVDETLFDTVYLSKGVVYKYRVNANGCYSLRIYDVTVIVNPGPRLGTLTTNAPDAPCSNMLYQTFAVSVPPVSGVRYDWYANNAFIWSGTADHQSVYVNFNNPGKAYVRVRGTVIASGCQTGDSLFVNVTSGIADNPKVIYYQGQFICLQSDMDTYQWGYDDVATFVSTELKGATLQNVYQPNADLSHRRYWVITTHNGCTQKSYYNSPLGVNEVANADIADVKVFPNPTQNNINVEINSSVDGDIQVDVLNLLGQKLTRAIAANHKATIDVSNLPAGCYLVDCYRDGIKIATSRFIKN